MMNMLKEGTNTEQVSGNVRNNAKTGVNICTALGRNEVNEVNSDPYLRTTNLVEAERSPESSRR